MVKLVEFTALSGVENRGGRWGVGTPVVGGTNRQFQIELYFRFEVVSSTKRSWRWHQMSNKVGGGTKCQMRLEVAPNEVVGGTK